MPEKFFDILPPQPSVRFEPKKLSEKLPKEKPKEKPTRRKLGLILIFGALIVIAVFVCFSLVRVKIEIWPETQILNFKERIEINSQKNQPDFSAKVFPGKIFEEELEISQEFSATAKILKAAKAHGATRVYNAYSDVSQVLVATTRFVSADGKLFRTPDRVTIPGGRYEKGKLVPGEIDIKVVADQPGPEYNIGPSIFSIPGFAGTPKYTAFYGKSFSAMTGGSRGEAPQVTQTDLDKAKDTLVNKLFEEGRASLKNKISSDFVLLNEDLTQEITEAVSSVQAGAEAQTFNFRVKERLKILAFKKSDLENFAKEFILSRISQMSQGSPNEILAEENFWSGKKIQDESLRLDYEISSIDWKEGKMVLNLTIGAKIYPDINEALIKGALLGKSLKEAQLLLTGQPKVKKTEIKFFPFWVKKIPQKEEKIEIKLNLDPAPISP